MLELLAQRQSTAQIARALVLSASAVRVHIAAVVRKLRWPTAPPRLTFPALAFVARSPRRAWPVTGAGARPVS